METLFNNILLALVAVLVGFAVVGGAGGLIGRLFPARSKWARRLIGGFEMLSVLAIPYIVMVILHVSGVVEVVGFTLWIFAMGFGVASMQAGERARDQEVKRS